MRNVSDKLIGKIKTRILCSVTFFFFRKSWLLCDNAVKYGRSGQATDDSIIRRMRCACWITTATDTHPEYVLLLFHDIGAYANGPHCYLMRTLPVLCVISGFRREVDEIWALLGYYAVYSGNSLPSFRDSLSVPSSRVMKSKKKVRKESPLAA